MKRGFTIIESVCMLAAIFMVSWISLAVLKKNGMWPFKQLETMGEKVGKNRISPIKPQTVPEPAAPGKAVAEKPSGAAPE